ncbi:MAG: copper resistance protein NlpE N-terminal domain-containing protein [Bacteroidetes bacterium]|nr:copper resistance protein NlpE N-terminal domain-containing protein [Bacteroidota bacterium]
MKNTRRSRLRHLIVTAILLCASAAPANAQEHTSRNSLDWSGTYTGTVPCADCEGIGTTVLLRSNGTFRLEQEYRGRSAAVFTDSGRFLWKSDGRTIELRPMNGERRLFSVGEEKLTMLDKNGRPVRGPLAQHYILTKERPLLPLIDEVLRASVRQSLAMARSLEERPGMLPRSTDKNGALVTCTSQWWTSGFFPGTLWYLYESSGNDTLRRYAEMFTRRVEREQYTTDNHDVGFMINNSYGNAYRITGDTLYRRALLNASRSLLTRFHPVIGATRSWDTHTHNRHWQFAVIIDNMMNMELLLRSAAEFSEPSFTAAARSHAGVTMRHHFRPNGSSYHVVSYDTVTGQPHRKQTAQGYSDSSAWARGQAWGLYGFTMMYRFTRDTAYVRQAERIADFILHHPRLPADKVPYWDFDAPSIPDAPRDASAAAIIASALIELSRYTAPERRREYLRIAELQLRSLSSPEYRNAPGTHANFLLRHSVGSIPHKSEIDVPVSYADYYFVEALLRMKNILAEEQHR